MRQVAQRGYFTVLVQWFQPCAQAFLSDLVGMTSVERADMIVTCRDSCDPRASCISGTPLTHCKDELTRKAFMLMEAWPAANCCT